MIRSWLLKCDHGPQRHQLLSVSHRFAFDATSKQLIKGLAPSRYVDNLLLSLQDEQVGSGVMVLS